MGVVIARHVRQRLDMAIEALCDRPDAQSTAVSKAKKRARCIAELVRDAVLTFTLPDGEYRDYSQNMPLYNNPLA